MDREALTADQRKIFFDRLHELRPDRVHKIFRGNDRTRMLPRYGLTRDDIPQPFNDFFFLYGDKGHYFLQKITQEADRVTRRFGIDDVSDDFFGVIFDIITSALTARYSTEIRQRIDQFKLEQPTVPTFFSNLADKHKLVSAVAGLPDLQRVKIRDYYLTLLHHLGKSDYYPFSFLLSTTKSFKVAQQFSEMASRRGDELILFGWIPRGSADILATPRFAPGKGNLLTKLDLPRYDKSFFPHEQEITLKGGLFPDYIYGYLYSENGKPFFEVNPYLFEALDPNWLERGLPVDQTEFRPKFNKTRFTSGFMLTEETGTYSGI